MAAAKKVFCDVCGVSLPSASLLPTHNKGKKHQKLLSLKQERESSCKKSIYVRGFQNSGSIEEELTKFFSVYGKVTNIFLDKDKGVFAIVEFADEESVTTILHQESLPLLNEKRLTVKERTVNKTSFQNKTLKVKKKKPEDSQPHLHSQQQNKEIAEFVSEELVNKLNSSVYTVQEQVSLLMQQLCLTEEDVKLRRLVCQLLQEVFREVHSGASVVPFGSTVTGVGWKGSDLDVCLLALSQHGDAGVDYSLVIDVLRSFAPGCVNIIPVLTAKCPLIKFTHQPSGLSCDLSVNNRLGVANSDLLHCYMSLDPRVPQLVFIVRAWAKAKSLTVGRQLSSYALTLMVLYYLQTQTPPVIPSLQQGFDAWIKEHSDKQVAKQLDCNVIDNWDCSFFKEISRLSPSQNIKNLSQLLEEFFRFFSTEFDFSSCVVNIRTGCETTIISTLEELKDAKRLENDANTTPCSNKDGVNHNKEFNSTTSELITLSTEHSAEHQKTQPCSSTSSSDTSGKRVEFKLSPVCVQDPFELRHNLTQHVPASALKHVVELMKDAHKICRELNSPNNSLTTLLDLLTVCKTAKKRKTTNCHSFFFQEAVDLSCAAKGTTTRSVFLFIVEILEKEFGLKCERNGSSTKRRRSESETSLSKRQRIEGEDLENSQDTQMGKDSQEAHSVLQDSQDTQMDKDLQEDHSVKGTSESDTNSRTQAEQENVKKTKDTDDNYGEKFSAICTAFENTWTHCRRERRKSLQFQRQTNENMETAGQEMSTDNSPGKSEESSSFIPLSCKQLKGFVNVNPIASPILILELKVNSSSQSDANMAGYTVSMRHVESREFQLFGNFFSAFKKHFMGLITK